MRPLNNFFGTRCLVLMFLILGLGLALPAAPVSADDPNLLEDATLDQLIKVLGNTITLNDEELKEIAEKISDGDRESGKIKEYASSCQGQARLLKERIVPEIGSAYFGQSKVRELMAVLQQQWVTSQVLVAADEWMADTIEALKEIAEAWRNNDGKYRGVIEKMARMAADNLDERELAELVKALEDIAKLQKEANAELVSAMAPGLNIIRDARAQGKPGAVAGDGIVKAWSTYEQIRQALLKKYWDILDYLDVEGRSGKALAAFKLGGHARFELALAGLKAAATEYDFRTKLTAFREQYTRVIDQYKRLVEESCAFEKADDFTDKAIEYKKWWEVSKDTLEKAVTTANEFITESNRLFAEREKKTADLAGTQVDRERIKDAREDFIKHRTRFHDDMVRLSKEFAAQRGFGEWTEDDEWDTKPGSEFGYATTLNIKANLCHDFAAAIVVYDTDLRKWILNFNDAISAINTCSLCKDFANGSLYTFSAWSVPAEISVPAAIAKAISDQHLRMRFAPLEERAKKDALQVSWKLLPGKLVQLDNLWGLVNNFGEVYVRPFYEAGQWMWKGMSSLIRKLKAIKEQVRGNKLDQPAMMKAINAAWDEAMDGDLSELDSMDFADLDEMRDETTDDTWEAKLKGKIAEARSKAVEMAGKADPAVKTAIEKHFDVMADVMDDGSSAADDVVDEWVDELEEAWAGAHD